MRDSDAVLDLDAVLDSIPAIGIIPKLFVIVSASRHLPDLAILNIREPGGVLNFSLFVRHEAEIEEILEALSVGSFSKIAERTATFDVTEEGEIISFLGA